MDIYDQHEQGERVRSWLRDNFAAILTGIVIGLGAIFGYHQWQNHQARQSFTAAELYERARVDSTPALAVDGTPAATPPDAEAANVVRAQLRKDYPRSGFAILSALEQAESQLAAKDLAGARDSLIWVRDNSKEPALATLASVRLARLELAEGQAEQALKTLDAIAGDDFAAQRAELRGDIHASLGQDDQARTAYLDAKGKEGSDLARLDVKLSQYGAVEETTNGEGA
jgi:predicted negative regulator of RcsB-dependent stress response